MSNPLISVVSPEYGGAKMVSELVRRVKESVSKITEDFEIILVNDASPDNTWEEIEKECAKDKRVKGLDLSRNFGQHYAITAGLNYVKGEWVVVMDCDLQDRPEAIPDLYYKALEGWDIVYARRLNKKFGFWKKMSSNVFHSVYDWLTGMKTDSLIGNFGIYKNVVILEYNKMTELARDFQCLISYLGFKSTTIEVEHSVRLEGVSSYSLRKLIKLAFDVMISNTNKPLKMAVGCGIIMAMLSLLLAFYNVVAKYIGIISVEGYTSLVFSIWFVGGILLMVLGIVGLYVGKIFDQVKGRPLYIVEKRLNFDNVKVGCLQE